MECNWRSTIDHESHSAPSFSSLNSGLLCFSLTDSDSFSPSWVPPPPPVRRTSVMCSGATQRNKAPYWVQSAWVNVLLGTKPQETGKKMRRGGQLKERREEIKRKGNEMERTSGIICNSLCALLRHFIQHLVKQDLFCFAFVVWNARRSQFVGSFVKCWTASVASRRCHGAEKSSLTQLECRWESGLWRLPCVQF